MSTNLNNLNLNLKGNELSIRKTEVQTTGSVLKKMAATYEEHAKLVFLFDVSSSMSETIARAVSDNYFWEPGKLDQIRKAVSDAIARANGSILTGSLPAFGDAQCLSLADPDRDPSTGGFVFTPSDDDLKGRIVRTGATDFFGVRELSWSEVSSAKRSKKIDVVRNLARQEIKARFDKYPKARVGVVAFGNIAVTIFDDGNPDDLWPHLDRLTLTNEGGGFQEFVMGGELKPMTDWKGTPRLKEDGTPMMEMVGGTRCGGGTSILNGMRQGMEICRDKPSAVGIHHFILVSDGEDYEADHHIGSWLPALKASGVVLDYIHIGAGSLNEGVKKVAEALGGTCVQVTTEDELKEKFIEAAQRLCLPAGTL